MRTSFVLVLALVLIPSLGLAGVGQAQAQPYSVSPVPIWGIVLGTIIVAGLLYLIVHGPDGGYYRYPYYGEYYQYYYHPWYRPYFGFYPVAAPLILVAPVVVGTVLGIVAVDSFQYIVSRDAYGHYYRYPYYGPYRQVYYRPMYRPYAGTYAAEATFRAAPVRLGDPRWDNDKRILAPANQRPQIHQQSVPGPQPRTPPRPRPTYQQPQRQYQPPAYQQQQRQYQQPPRQPNPGRSGGRSGPGGTPAQRCGGPQQPPCPNNGQHP
ncbi:MAG TPA: hypothetical protein VJT33_02010 [bacterium]|nr:hypothetical protein [bacterium]